MHTNLQTKLTVMANKFQEAQCNKWRSTSNTSVSAVMEADVLNKTVVHINMGRLHGAIHTHKHTLTLTHPLTHVPRHPVALSVPCLFLIIPTPRHWRFPIRCKPCDRGGCSCLHNWMFASIVDRMQDAPTESNVHAGRETVSKLDPCAAIVTDSYISFGYNASGRNRCATMQIYQSR